jgi:cystathionine beta-lyase/cystathionine gamma-synthase
MSESPETKSVKTKKVVPANPPLTLPIYQTSTYSFDSPEQLEHYLEDDESYYLYTRYENPTLRAVEQKIAELEKGDSCFVFSSGMAAITSSILAFAGAGDEIVASDSLYGRTQTFLEKWMPKLGAKVRFVPLSRFPDIQSYFSEATRIVYIETPTNPTLQVIDIAAAAEAAHRNGALLLIDSTFASPVNQNPLELGADIVLHSLTKYIAGHSDVIAGAAIFAEKHRVKLREALRTFGGTLDPLAAYLVERGIKTLYLRVEKQNRTAQILAERLADHSSVLKVNYPGLSSHVSHQVAARQMRGFGGMLSFDLANYHAARKFAGNLKIIHHAASLGGVESLVSLPILTSHHKQPKSNLDAAGISEGTVRLSVGIENQEDLWNDVIQALI